MHISTWGKFVEILNNEDFFDRMAADYHELMPDWQSNIREDGVNLKELIVSLRGDRVSRVLDCACGIGTQAIGLAMEGYDVVASDISRKEVERAKREAADFGVSIDFRVADFRHLEDSIGEEFDVVLAFDNSLAHVETDADILAGLKSMRGRLKLGGHLLLGLRDYDAPDLAKRPPGTAPRIISGPSGQRMAFQMWEWGEADDPMYTSQFFILREDGDHWKVAINAATRIRAIKRGDLVPLLDEAGYSEVTAKPNNNPHYPQNIFTAIKAA